MSSRTLVATCMSPALLLLRLLDFLPPPLVVLLLCRCCLGFFFFVFRTRSELGFRYRSEIDREASLLFVSWHEEVRLSFFLVFFFGFGGADESPRLLCFVDVVVVVVFFRGTFCFRSRSRSLFEIVLWMVLEVRSSRFSCSLSSASRRISSSLEGLRRRLASIANPTVLPVLIDCWIKMIR